MPSGDKPRYLANPAHDPRAPLPNKTPEPTDAAVRYDQAVPGKIVNGKCERWYALAPGGEIYRYSSSNDGTAHFSGMTGGKEGLRFESIPIEVRRQFKRVR